MSSASHDFDPLQFFGKARRVFARLKEQAERLKSEEQIIREAKRELAERSLTHSAQVVEISTASVAKATLAVLGIAALAFLLVQIAPIIILFLIAGFLAIALDPIVTRCARYRIPRGVTIVVLYAVFFSLFAVVISSFIPILTTEIPNLAKAVLSWAHTSLGIDTSLMQEKVTEFQGIFTDLQQHVSKENIQIGLNVLQTIGANAFAVLSSVAGGVFSVSLVLMTTFFMIVEEDGIKKFLMSLLPSQYHAYAIEKAQLVESKFGSWLRGQVILMCAVGILIYIALKIAGVHYALTLATLAGLTELIPYVGPFIAVIPALIIAASQDGFLFSLIVLAIYVGVQQLENNILVPLIMERAVGLSPIVIMFAMLVGASFPEYVNPIVGIILAVPVATAIAVFVNDYALRPR